jgi:nitrite reductase/ring-hydroxylating ferredoxin subunit
LAVPEAVRVAVCPAGELPPGSRRLVVPFRGRAGIGVFNVAGRYFALRNLCPHKTGPLCTGKLTGRVVATGPPSAGDAGIEVEREGEVIRCPWHLWEFDIETGHCLVDPSFRVKTYPVRVEEGEVVVYAREVDLPEQPVEASLG